MNCDEAFELLTDLTQRPSGALRQHLAGCPRCRQMQETLAPALAGLQDELTAQSREDGRATQSSSARPATEHRPHFLSVEAVDIAECAARRLTARAPFCRLGLRRLAAAAARYVVAFSVGAVVALGAVSGEPEHMAPRHLLTAVPKVTSCTRSLMANLEMGPTVDARNVVMSCVACHLASR
jgi:hypothetical protein